MPQIRQLAPHVADLIAAGEVVERPASVVKELVENAVDAGASAVVTEIRRGGMGLIRVSDNGCGIAPEELPTAFLRHATSKLRAPEDLSGIGTLGFRGEALAAISAVSRVDILTRQRGSVAGASLHLEGGVPGAVEDAGAPEGTSISVRDLFYNTPARLKFMRKDSAETSAVAGLMQHLALSHPEVSFKFLKDGAEALHTPGDGKLLSAVYASLGRDFARGLVPVEGRGGDTAVSGFITAPLQGRGSRAMQIFFVNGRFIKSQLLTAALEEGYRSQLMKGKFPGCVLFVTLPVTLVDVNVHPAKTQVKFAREREVFDAVFHTVLDSLARQGGPLSAPAPGAEEASNPRQDFFQNMDARTYRQQAAGPASPTQPKPRRSWNAELGGRARVSDVRQETPRKAAALGSFGAPPSVLSRGETAERAPGPRSTDGISDETPERFTGSSPEEAAFYSAASQRRTEAASGGSPKQEAASAGASERSGGSSGAEAASGAPSSEAASRSGGSSAYETLPPAAPLSGSGRASGTAAAARPAIRAPVPAIPGPDGEEDGQQSLEPRREAPWRIAGEVLHTYIVCESGDGCVVLIDKHAAHERVNYDRLKAAAVPPMRQTLMQPVAAELSQEDGALLLENLSLLEQLGFGCEDFGGGTVLVREVPADIDGASVSSTLEELAENLRTGRSPEERRENLLHTMACKAAIKGGWTSDAAELRALVEKVQSGEVKYCPHGRPVAVRLTRYELERMFKRA